MYCYANIGVPKNIDNPYYQQTDKESNPHGYNSRGTKYIDYGLGANPNPAPDGTRFYKNIPGDIPQFRGLFKAPSMRGTDKRPSPDFVKAYMHNGVFKSLKDVVHFYNKRNIAVDADGKEIAFDLRESPPSGYTPLFPPPEVLEDRCRLRHRFAGLRKTDRQSTAYRHPNTTDHRERRSPKAVAYALSAPAVFPRGRSGCNLWRL